MLDYYGKIKECTISDGFLNNLNAFARVIEINNLNKNVITISNITEGQFANFNAGENVLLHISATNLPEDTENILGNYFFRKITLVNENIITLDEDIPEIDLSRYYLQIITVPDFKKLNIESTATLTPPPFDPFKFTGGILIFTAKNLVLEGNIDLTDCGIPPQKAYLYRPITTQENAANGQTDAGKLAGMENVKNTDSLLLNAGDGATMIFADILTFGNKARIGNPKTHGVQYCRGAADSPNKPVGGVSIIGGSSIYICAKEINNFKPDVIAKYRISEMEGRGIARCNILTETPLRHDDALYSLGVNPTMFEPLEFTGDNVTLKNYPANCARVYAVAKNGFQIFFEDRTLNGFAQIKENALVIVQELAGKFVVSRALKVAADHVILEKPFKGSTPAQIIFVPEFNEVVINSKISCQKFDNGSGGVFAVAADVIDLRGGRVIVEGKGGGSGFSDFYGASNARDVFPLGKKHGSIFLIANRIIFDDETRLGVAYNSNVGTLNLPYNTNGPVIYIVAKELEGFTDSVLAVYDAADSKHCGFVFLRIFPVP